MPCFLGHFELVPCVTPAALPYQEPLLLHWEEASRKLWGMHAAITRQWGTRWHMRCFQSCFLLLNLIQHAFHNRWVFRSPKPKSLWTCSPWVAKPWKKKASCVFSSDFKTMVVLVWWHAVHLLLPVNLGNSVFPRILVQVGIGTSTS